MICWTVYPVIGSHWQCCTLHTSTCKHILPEQEHIVGGTSLCDGLVGLLAVEGAAAILVKMLEAALHGHEEIV